MLHQVDAHMTFTMEEQLLPPVAYDQCHKKIAIKQGSLSGTALSWFQQLNESYKNDGSRFVSASNKTFPHKKLHIRQKLKLKS